MSERIPILHFSNALARGGAEEHILTLLRGLNRIDFRLHLVCTPTVAKLLAKDLPPDVEVFPLALHKPQQVKAAFELSGILRQKRIQILHSHLFYASLFASPVGRLSGVPVIVETTHVREQWRQGWLKSRFFVDRAVGRCVTHYIAVSQANADYLEKGKGLPPEKIHVIRNGSDLSRFRARGDSENLRARLGLTVDAPILLVAGRLEPQKGHSVLLEALPNIRRRFPQVCAVFAGEGALESQLQKQVESLGLQECVKFVGFQRNMQEWYSLADVKVLPSFFEGLPLVAVESLAVGTPVVATAVDGTPEIVVNEQNGLTVPAGDAVALANAICRLLENPGLRQRYGEAGRRWVHEHFTEEEQVRRTEQLYLRALGMESRAAEIVRAEVKLHDSEAVQAH
jgi:glycosyltransferase involved in cell wall biosynthesis